ncbi:zinc finger BED domain-containing protein RICESLEEPER 2-like [Lactuca sativa]|uniref:zinc finger BED domain-containing protein RICESLEEPER 2-like n=1 Tax=Lactuca sativa TaxID=4236 RepID=UPI0022B00170|nr:zinc finger BED domain-containing protein RICESLEEPER 2-like [Lactuca sativa]
MEDVIVDNHVEVDNEESESDDSTEEVEAPNESQGVESTSSKKRKTRTSTSDVWKSFTKLPRKTPNEALYCVCNKCGQKYKAGSESGTDGLKQIDVVVEKVRECVKYVKGSSARKTRFSQSFSHLSLSDSNFQDCPYSNEWERVEKLCSFMKVFYDTTLQFSGSVYPTSNLYFPQIFGIHLKLVEEKKSPDEYITKIATQMWNKFNKYWADFNVLLAIVVVFDPRYKLLFIEFCYKNLYGEGSSQFKAIESALYELHDEYVQASKNATTYDSTSHQGSNDNIRQNNVGGESSQNNILEEFDEYDNDDSGSNTTSQLHVYLLEPRAKRTSSINMLEFWKAQQYRYPKLTKLAMDILCVPVSTVASKSVFSLGGRILNEYRSSMKPDVVEALVCSRDWLFGEKVDLNVAIDNLTQNVMNLNINEDNTEVILKKLVLEEEMGIVA